MGDAVTAVASGEEIGSVEIVVPIFDCDGTGALVALVPYLNGENERTINLIASAPALLEALREFADEPIGEEFSCHLGIVAMADCSRCRRILRARAAIAAATGEEVNA